MDYNFITNPSLLNENGWTSFVYEHPHGNIFYLPEMLRIYENTPGYQPVFLACLDNESTLQGLIVGVIQVSRSRFLQPFTSRCIVWGGPLVKDNSAVLTDLLLRELDKLVSKKTIYIQFRILWDLEELKNVFNKYNFQYEDHLDVHIDIRAPKDVLWGRIKSNARNKIRKAEGHKLKIMLLNSEEQIKSAYKILKEVYTRVALPLADEQLFFNAFHVLGVTDKIYFFGAYLEEELIGVRIVLAFKETLYDWYAGAKRYFQYCNANDFLVWKIMEWGLDNGYSVFDFGGAGKPDKKYGVRDYKMKFGGELINFGRYTKINNKIKMLLGKTGLKIIKLSAKIMRFLNIK